MAINFRQTRYSTSAADLSGLPKDSKIEIAFAGRSNAGKSSAINALCDQKSLAKTSNTPGRTQLLNYFTIQPELYLVDLPGYGFAKVPKATKAAWHALLETYFEQRQQLQGLVLIMDCRHPLRDLDWQMLEWCRYADLPSHVVLSKADKLRGKALENVYQECEQALIDYGYHNTAIQLLSSTKKTGIEQLADKLSTWCSLANDSD